MLGERMEFAVGPFGHIARLAAYRSYPVGRSDLMNCGVQAVARVAVLRFCGRIKLILIAKLLPRIRVTGSGGFIHAATQKAR
jgi:hypothetical protein